MLLNRIHQPTNINPKPIDFDSIFRKLAEAKDILNGEAEDERSF